MRAAGVLFMVVAVFCWVGLVRGEDSPSSKDGPSKEATASKAKFHETDADGDGHISPQELEKSATVEFRAYDRDGDLKVTEDELTQGLALTHERMDLNSDRVVTLEEFRRYHFGEALDDVASAPAPTTAANPDFKAADANGDGKLAPREYHSFQDACGFVLHDINGDSAIHFDEVKATAKGRFRDMDLNRDGVITEQEYVGCSIGIPALRDRNR